MHHVYMGIHAVSKGFRCNPYLMKMSATSFERMSINGKPCEMCPRCGTPLRYAFQGKRHVYHTMEAMVETITSYYACENGHYFHPVDHGVLPGKKYGIDVYAFVSYERFHERKTFLEIRDLLRREHGLPISTETVRSMALYYEVASSMVIKPGKVEEMKANKGVVLSIDGARPLKGHCALYVVRDVLTSVMLGARFFESATNDKLAELLQSVKGFLDNNGIPIHGVVSDKEASEVAAINAVFPGVPYQYCQFHFLRDIAKPSSVKDREVHKNLRKRLGRNPAVRHFKKNSRMTTRKSLLH